MINDWYSFAHLNIFFSCFILDLEIIFFLNTILRDQSSDELTVLIHAVIEADEILFAVNLIVMVSSKSADELESRRKTAFMHCT